MVVKDILLAISQAADAYDNYLPIAQTVIDSFRIKPVSKK